MNESSDFGHFESESASQQRSSQDVFLELAERSHQVSWKSPCKLLAWPLSKAIHLKTERLSPSIMEQVSNCVYTYHRD